MDIKTGKTLQLVSKILQAGKELCEAQAAFKKETGCEVNVDTRISPDVVRIISYPFGKAQVLDDFLRQLKDVDEYKCSTDDGQWLLIRTVDTWMNGVRAIVQAQTKHDFDEDGFNGYMPPEAFDD